jgi:hypothetical protein
MFMTRTYLVGVLLAVLGAGCGGGGGVGGPPPSDTERPRIASVDATRQAGKIVVEAVVTDAGGSGVAQVRVLTPDTSVVWTMPPAGPNLYRLELPAETGRMRIWARDGAGNEALSDWILAPAPDPPDFQ